MIDLHYVASRLPGGRVINGGVSFQALGHGPGDASGRVLPDPTMRNCYSAFSFAGDDALALRDFIDERCGFPRWGDRVRQERPDPQQVVRQERAREQQRMAREAEARIKAERIARLWRDAQTDVSGTLVETYLTKHRGVILPETACGYTIRFLMDGPWEGQRVPMMLCAFRDIITDEVCGLHRTHLDPATGAKLGRKMLGRAGGAAIKLTPDAEVTMGLSIAEGVESALAGMMLGLVPMWALGSVGGIAAFPVLNGVEALTVCAETGEASERAVQEVGTRWTEVGREVEVITPRAGSDLNDALRAGGGAWS